MSGQTHNASQNHVLKHTAIGRGRRELPLRGTGKWLIAGEGLAPPSLTKPVLQNALHGNLILNPAKRCLMASAPNSRVL